MSKSSTNAFEKYQALLRDANNIALTESTRVHAVFDAIFAICYCCGGLEPALAKLKLDVDDAELVVRLQFWVHNIAPQTPLPMPPNAATALAERVYRAVEASCCE